MAEASTKNKKKLFVKTFGCQMNVYDSERMMDVLGHLGYDSVEKPDDADLVILNTCHIREKASEKVYSDLGRLRELRKKKEARTGEGMALAVAGCVAQAEGAEIIRRAPYVDMVFGPQTYHRLPEFVTKLEREQKKKQGKQTILDTDFPIEPKFDALPEERENSGTSAFLSIQEGCDKFCTFCVVPYTRGAEFSRPITSIMGEAKKLIAAGAREISVLGQNVNAYHGEGPDGKEWNLGQLLFELAELDGLDRIRYTTSHPRDMHEELYEAHAKIPQLMPYLHLPVQSGSDRVLDAMNRKHTAEEFLRMIDRLREGRPDIAFSSDIIVGFPGESDKDFADTMKLVEAVNFAQCFSFKYSARPGTPASAHQLQVAEDVKIARLAELQDLLNKQQHEFNQSCVGKTLPVLFEKKAKLDGQIGGKSPYLQSVNVMGNERLIGQIVDVEITEGLHNSLKGELVIDESELMTPDEIYA